jgi:hypothetical protein
LKIGSKEENASSVCDPQFPIFEAKIGSIGFTADTPGNEFTLKRIDVEQSFQVTISIGATRQGSVKEAHGVVGNMHARHSREPRGVLWFKASSEIVSREHLSHPGTGVRQ